MAIQVTGSRQLGDFEFSVLNSFISERMLAMLWHEAYAVVITLSYSGLPILWVDSGRVIIALFDVWS